MTAVTTGREGCPGDTVLTLYAVDGEDLREVASDDDSGDGVCSALDVHIDAGWYALVVIGRGAIESYRMDWALTVDVTAGGNFGGGFGEGGDDRFVFALASNRFVAFETSDGNGGCPGDTTVTLMRMSDHGPRAIDHDDDSGIGTCSRLEGRLAPGVYAIDVTGADGAAIDAYALGAELR